MHRVVFRAALFFTLLASNLATSASADLIVIYGFDSGVGLGGPHPDSDAAYARFRTLLDPTTIGIETFEGDLLGDFTGGTRSIAFASTGVTGAIRDLSSGVPQAAITNVDVGNGIFPVNGANYFLSNTQGNSNFFEITLSSPMTAFGFYGASLSDYGGIGGGPVPPIRLTLDGGAAIDVLNVDPRTIAAGSINFFGVVSDTPFTTVRMVNPLGTGNDGISVDDIVIGRVATVPEPSSLVSAALGLAALAGYAGWRRVVPKRGSVAGRPDGGTGDEGDGLRSNG